MSELRFTVEHEWLRQEADGLVTVGTVSYTHLTLPTTPYV